MKKSKIKLLDAVAILKDLPEKRLTHGQVGTVVEVLDSNIFEVEFSDKSGETIAEIALHSDDLLLLHHEVVKI
jgi:hypothetical protein